MTHLSLFANHPLLHQFAPRLHCRGYGRTCSTDQRPQLPTGAGAGLHAYPHDGLHRSLVHWSSPLHARARLLGQYTKRKACSAPVLLLVQAIRTSKHPAPAPPDGTPRPYPTALRKEIIKRTKDKKIGMYHAPQPFCLLSFCLIPEEEPLTPPMFANLSASDTFLSSQKGTPIPRLATKDYQSFSAKRPVTRRYSVSYIFSWVCASMRLLRACCHCDWASSRSVMVQSWLSYF